MTRAEERQCRVEAESARQRAIRASADLESRLEDEFPHVTFRGTDVADEVEMRIDGLTATDIRAILAIDEVHEIILRANARIAVREEAE